MHTAGDRERSRPIPLQRHNAGLFDAYQDLSVEVNPSVYRLLLVG